MSDLTEAEATSASRHAQALVDFIWESPSPFHAVDSVKKRLEAAGFIEIDEAAAPTSIAPGSCGFIDRGGALVAWRAGTDSPVEHGFRVAAAHTDSPNLRVKPVPDSAKEGYRLVGVEIYGGVLLHTWTDRDLGLSGRVMVQGKNGPTARLFRVDEPMARVANIAIHLNRHVNRDGAKFNTQRHMAPMVGLGEWKGLVDWIGEQLGGEKVLSWELGFHDTQKPCLGGLNKEFIFAPRLDNLGSCYTIMAAMLDAKPAAHTQVMALFDHEEVGSRTYRGAMGPMLGDVIDRIVADHECQAPGGRRRAAANSWMVSSDMAHGVHPNFADKHEPNHKPMLGGGPVLKGHVEHRYATEAETTARWRAACAAVGVPCQEFVNRTDLACGSTVGPMIATELGISTVDVGMAMLSMHSVREQSGSADVQQMKDVIQHIYEQG
jgi:aspartyl aminopeptidase